MLASNLLFALSANAQTTALFLDSQPGDPVGLGQERTLTPTEFQFVGRTVIPLGDSHVNIRVSDNPASPTIQWDLRFNAPGMSSLSPGSYPVVVRSDLLTTLPGLHVYQGDRQCDVVTGRFVIYEFVVFAREVIRFAADFEQHCDGAAAALMGAIRINANRQSLVPFEGETRVKDFSGDGWPDLVWRHPTTGRNAFWFMREIACASTPAFSPGAELVADLDWEIRAVADVNRDGYGDVIWQHSTSGKIAAWLFVGATRMATPLFSTLSGASVETDLQWKIVGAADMNADGYPDLLWRHRTSGMLRVWQMQGLKQLRSVDLALSVPDALWEVAGVADINADGFADVVWRHYGNGRLAVWLMADTLVRQTIVLPQVVGDVNWRLAGLADFDGDGHPDFLWQHAVYGKLALWYMDGLTTTRSAPLTPETIGDPAWRIVGVK